MTLNVLRTQRIPLISPMYLKLFLEMKTDDRWDYFTSIFFFDRKKKNEKRITNIFVCFIINFIIFFIQRNQTNARSFELPKNPGILILWYLMALWELRTKNWFFIFFFNDPTSAIVRERYILVRFYDLCISRKIGHYPNGRWNFSYFTL